jgi:thiamine-monophosphate kinase
VTGTLGDAATALLLLGCESHLGPQFAFTTRPNKTQEQALLERYYTPQPRTDFAQQAREHINACIDLSDGLLGDLAHILEASGVSAQLTLEALPYSKTLMAVLCAEQRERVALGGGDDYELCFTVAPESVARVQAIARSLGLAVTPIGVITEGSGLTLNRAGEAIELTSNAYRHF